MGIGFWQLVILLVIVLVIVAMRRRTVAGRREAARLLAEVNGDVPGWSAETRGGKAESIADRLRRRHLLTAFMLLAAIAAFGAAVWWLTR